MRRGEDEPRARSKQRGRREPVDMAGTAPGAEEKEEEIWRRRIQISKAG